MDRMKEKEKYRSLSLEKLKDQHINERKKSSRIIQERVISSREFENAEVIMFYAAMTYEVETVDIIRWAFQSGKKVILPLFDTIKREISTCEIKSYENDTELCKFGFREPKRRLQGNIDVKAIDLVLVPGVCFDKKNNRLGHGIGCYDKFIPLLKNTAISIGLAFDFQIFDTIPTEAHDKPLNLVISNVQTAI